VSSAEHDAPAAVRPSHTILERAETQLLQLAAAFDEPVAAEEYPLALLALGQRSRSLFQAFLELNAGAAPVAARALLQGGGLSLQRGPWL
jgi:hypothetical protein